MSRVVHFSSDPTVSEAAALVRVVAGKRRACDSVKLAICRAARQLGWTFRRTRTAWYRQGRLKAAEMDQLRAATRKANRDAADVLAELAAMVEAANRILAAHPGAPRRAGRNKSRAVDRPAATR